MVRTQCAERLCMPGTVCSPELVDGQKHIDKRKQRRDRQHALRRLLLGRAQLLLLIYKLVGLPCHQHH